jgi:uncharacterized protein YggE
MQQINTGDRNVNRPDILRCGAAALLVAGALTMSENMTQAQEVGASNWRTIRASGVGEVQAQPDLATIQFAVETTGETAQQAGEANADLMDRVIQALQAAGVSREDIRTSGYSLFPEYAVQPRDEPSGTPRIRGYRASNQVSVRSRDLDGLGRLIDVGLEAGANRLHGVSFELRDSAAAEAEALRRAVQSARASAETIAGALGVQLGAILDASTSSEPVRPLYREIAMESFDARGAMAATTPIEAGQQTVRAVASVVYEIQ